MKFLIFNITVVAALGYLVLSGSVPNPAITMQDVEPVAQAVEAAQAAVEQIIEEVHDQSQPEPQPLPVADVPVADVPVVEAPVVMAPIVEARVVDEPIVREVPQTMEPPAPILMSNAERRRELAGLAQSMEDMSLAIISHR